MSPPETFAERNSDFAIAMYADLRSRSGNLFFSPFSLRTVLDMAQAGARGETAAQLKAALRLPLTVDARRPALGAVFQRLNPAGRGNYALVVANSIWGQEGAPLRPGFMELVEDEYRGEMNLVDFQGAADTARQIINEWVEAKTSRKIPDLIPPGGLSAEARLVLVNAIYFKATWLRPFAEDDTRDQPFQLRDGGIVNAPLMYQQTYVPYAEAPGYQVVDLPYEGQDLSMLVLLPDQKDGLDDLEKALSLKLLADCVAQTGARDVELFLPRFRISWGDDLALPLVRLGMPLAFSRTQADFSGINGRLPPDGEAFYISGVFHRAFAEVYEEGTEAASATAIEMPRLLAAESVSEPPPVPVFRADHPFLFFIRDRRSGAVLFMGRVVDPTRQG